MDAIRREIIEATRYFRLVVINLKLVNLQYRVLRGAHKRH